MEHASTINQLDHALRLGNISRKRLLARDADELRTA
jgi:hypothetical protein